MSGAAEQKTPLATPSGTKAAEEARHESIAPRAAPLAGGDSVPGAFDALARQSFLRKIFKQAGDLITPTDPPPDNVSKMPESRRTLIRRSLKTAAGLFVLFAVGWLPAMRYFESASVEAVVNARLVTIRAPIDGEVVGEATTPLNVGMQIESGRILMRVVNRRADRSALNDLIRQIDVLEMERASLVGRVDSLRGFHALLLEQSKAFQAGRVLQLEARVAESNNTIAAATARRKEAVATLERVSALFQKGFQSRAALDKAVSDESAASEAENALRKRLLGVDIELEAARRGIFVGDSYNDQPNSTQRATETGFRIRELEAELKAREDRLGRLTRQQTEELQRQADLSAADLSIPIRGRIWEVLTSPGEEIRHGQDLLRVLDCSAALVTTAVTEKVFNRLQLGDAASVQVAGISGTYEGKIIHLTGMASPPENLAIQPASLARESWRVTVAVPNVKEGCLVGRSSRVVFAPTSPSNGNGGTLGSRDVGLPSAR
jgi:multidrug resistance efflux pump